jgi:hypothetical protein
MAQQVITTLIDDLDGETEAQDTVHFGLDGKSYEIDLCHANVSDLRSKLNQYVLVARKAGRAGRQTVSRPSVDREQNQAIREWARSQGKKVNDRGRIPADVVDAFHQSH